MIGLCCAAYLGLRKASLTSCRWSSRCSTIFLYISEKGFGLLIHIYLFGLWRRYRRRCSLPTQHVAMIAPKSLNRSRISVDKTVVTLMVGLQEKHKYCLRSAFQRVVEAQRDLSK